MAVSYERGTPVFKVAGPAVDDIVLPAHPPRDEARRQAPHPRERLVEPGVHCVALFWDFGEFAEFFFVVRGEGCGIVGGGGWSGGLGFRV